jgi:hypothetical protein
MKKLIFLLIPILFACVKENNHAPLMDRLTGYHKVFKVAVNDTVYYDTLRLTTNSSYLTFNRDNTGSVKFYSDFVWDYDFEYWTVEDDIIRIIDGPLKGDWRIPEHMDFINKAGDPQRTTFIFSN